jgi:hypothetical protein
VVDHRNIVERKTIGPSARDHVSRGDHAGWEPASGRPDPVKLLEDQNASTKLKR